MITLEDCIALCGLSKQEVMAIAEHEHVPEIAAAAMAKYLLKEFPARSPHGQAERPTFITSRASAWKPGLHFG